MGKGNYKGKRGRPVSIGTLCGELWKKRLNLSRCRLGGLWTRVGPRKHALDGCTVAPPTSMVSRHIESSCEPRKRNGRMRVGPTLETGRHGWDSDECWATWCLTSTPCLISDDDDVHSEGYLTLNSVKPPSSTQHTNYGIQRVQSTR